MAALDHAGLRLVGATASRALACSVAAVLGASYEAAEVARFPDGEVRPAVSGVSGADVFVIGSTGPPVADTLVELLLLVDACRRAGAGRITAVVPYFGYARQDRRKRPGEPVGARVVAEAITAVGADRLVVVDPHTSALEAMFAIPVEMVTAVPVLADTLRPLLPADAVVVAPDLGAVKLAERFAARVQAPVVVVRKVRLSGASVRAEELIGDVAGRPAVIVDDMISTGATIEAAIELLRSHGAAPAVFVAATHGLLVGEAPMRLGRAANAPHILVTDTVAGVSALGSSVHVASVVPLLAAVVERLHAGRSLEEFLLRS